jgi:SOS response regulatory protein OraA/RecX
MISEEIHLNEFLEHNGIEAVETDLARQAAYRWLSTHQKDKQRLARHLSSRGFSFDVINDILRSS